MAQKAADIKESYDLVLRLHDVTDVVFNGGNSHKYIDIKVNGEAGNWYLNVWEAGRTYVVDIGYRTASGRFILLARSNSTGTPRDKVSHVTDEEWMVIDEDFEEIFRVSGGGRLGGGASEGFRSVMESNIGMGSETVSSFSSPAGGSEQARGFFLWADTEIILYGGTEKDAALRVKGEKIDLKEDGTFSLRFHLPDGIMDLPVDATSSDGKETISIRISVERKSK